MATKSQLKQYFETGKIPTQDQFGNLIDSIFNIISSPDGSLNIKSDENNINLSIKNYRSLHGIYASSVSISLHLFFNNDIEHNTKPVPVFIIISALSNFNASATANIKYGVPNVTTLKSMADDNVNYLTASLDTIVKRFIALNITLYNLVPKEEEKNPSPRTIVINNSTYICWPVKQNNEWYVGIVWEMNVNTSGSNSLYRYYPMGNSQTKWNVSDQQVVDDLKTKWNKANV